MIEASDIIDSNTTIIYAFRFNTSDKLIHLTQQQLNHIPYLFNFVAHKDNFLLIQNENGEYVLNHPIQYTWFMPILHVIISKQPYTLFNEISEDDNVLGTLQLFDYLGIDSFPLPLLKDENLVQSNPTVINTDQNCLKYHKATLSEARETAAQFIIALSKIEYNFCDSYTILRIFSLIKVILFSAPVFSSRFRHHTLTVTKEFCYSFFSIKQQRLLPTTQQITQRSKIDSFIYLYENDQSLPDNFQNAFAWRGVYVPTKDAPLSPEVNRTEPLSAGSNSTTLSSLFFEQRHMSIYERLDYNIEVPSFFVNDTDDDEELPIYQTKQNQNSEAQSARSGRFNTLPKRPNVDRFKHRSRSKSRKFQ